ncbi:MAG: LytR C-terminal domain-containing protein [Candidatus Shapirobacteria bacterium]|nr:LytR C-terminal domain-containing protein [Candidatus Shapirobacteria bacterium]
MYLLFISKNNLEVFKNKQKVSEISWTTENLTQNLLRLKTTFSKKFRVILADDFISVTSLLLAQKEAKKRTSIQAKFQPTISEDLSQTTWDYKIVAHQNGQSLVQLIYVSKKFFDVFRNAVNSAKIKVDLLESFSTTISRFLPAKKLIFLHYQDLVVLVFNQTPIYSQVVKKKLTQEDIDHIFTYSKQCFQVLPQQILFAPTGDIAFNQFDFGNLQPEYTSVDPLKGIIHSVNKIGTDATTTRLEVPQKNIENSFPKWILLIPTVLLIITGFVVFGPKSTNQNQINPAVTVTPTVTAAPTPTPFNVSGFKIKVLNGTGIAGQASETVKLLESQNFAVQNTSNAASYDFTQTQIETKKTVPSEVVKILTDTLTIDSPPKISPKNLPDTSEFDIIITTGKK